MYKYLTYKTFSLIDLFLLVVLGSIVLAQRYFYKETLIERTCSFKMSVWVDMFHYLESMTSVTANLCINFPAGQNFNPISLGEGQTWTKLLIHRDPIIGVYQISAICVSRKGKKVTLYTKLMSEIPFLWLYYPLFTC